MTICYLQEFTPCSRKAGATCSLERTLSEQDNSPWASAEDFDYDIGYLHCCTWYTWCREVSCWSFRELCGFQGGTIVFHEVAVDFSKVWQFLWGVSCRTLGPVTLVTAHADRYNGKLETTQHMFNFTNSRMMAAVVVCSVYLLTVTSRFVLIRRSILMLISIGRYGIACAHQQVAGFQTDLPMTGQETTWSWCWTLTSLWGKLVWTHRQ